MAKLVVSRLAVTLACSPGGLSSNPAWGKLVWTNFLKREPYLGAVKMRFGTALKLIVTCCYCLEHVEKSERKMLLNWGHHVFIVLRVASNITYVQQYFMFKWIVIFIPSQIYFPFTQETVVSISAFFSILCRFSTPRNLFHISAVFLSNLVSQEPSKWEWI